MRQGRPDRPPDKEKAGRVPGLSATDEGWRGSALAELEAPAGLGLAVLLALDLAVVAGQEDAGLPRAPQARVVGDQRPADAVAHRTGLAREAAARDRHRHVVLAEPVDDRQRPG